MQLNLCLIVNAQLDHLIPETGYFSGYRYNDSYYPKVKRLFQDTIFHIAEAAVYILPSFTRENLISIDTYEDNKTFLTYKIAKYQIWSHQLMDSNSYKSYRIEIDTALANKIQTLFFMAISKVCYPEKPETGLDGTTYIFVAFKIGFGNRSGKALSPGGGKLMELVEITDWLTACAQNGKLFERESMIIKIDDLINKFNEK